MTSAGIVLAGGRSSRMGTAKADLEWHGSTLLRRTVGVLAMAVDGPVIVVAAPGQRLPALPAGVRPVADPEPAGRGPVVGLAAGLAEAGRLGAATAFACATDLPFLHPAYVRRVLTALADEVDAALPDVAGHRQPLAAAYRTSLAPVLAAMAEAGEYRLRALFERCRVRGLDAAALLADPELAAADPGLESVVNVNSPEDYAAARARPAPSVTVRRGDRSYPLRAATVAEAAAALGIQVDQDAGHRPLFLGDTLVLGESGLETE